MLTWLLIAVGAIVLLRKFSSTATPTETPPAAKPTGSPPYPAPPGMQWVWVQQPYTGPWPAVLNWTPPPQPYVWHLQTVKAGAPAPQPAPGEIIVQPLRLPTSSEPQGETADEVPVNKTEPLGVYYKI